MPRAATVLISGAGIAGATLAYWLRRAGFTPVLVESAPALRTGGYMIDFWGPGFEVAERMNLDHRLRHVGYRVRELRVVDNEGLVRARVGTEALLRSMGERYVSLLRGDLAAELYRLIEGRVEILLGEEVMALNEDGSGVQAHFASGALRRFDLVVGADGLHSRVRRLVFGTRKEAEVPLGYFAAAFTAASYPHRDELVYVSHATRGRQVARFALRDRRTVFFMVLLAELAQGRLLHTVDQQKAFLRDAFVSAGGWEMPDVLRALERAEDLYFDTVSQIRLPRWACGRVALLGDAASCPSLLVGEGASLAMAGAYLLAGELASRASHEAAYAAYESRLRPLIARKQQAARRIGGWFAPRTRFGLHLRNLLTRVAGVPALSRMVAGSLVRDELVLPAYDWPSLHPAALHPHEGH